MTKRTQTNALQMARQFVARAPMYMTLLDLDGRFIEFSPSLVTDFIEVTGFSRSGLIGQAVADATETSAAPLRHIFERLASGEAVVEFEGEHRPAQGRRFSLRSQASYWRDDAGDPIGVLIVNQDVTAEIEARAALAESAAQLRAVVDNIPAEISLVDVESGRILLSNGQANAGIWSWTAAQADLRIDDGLDPALHSRLNEIVAGVEAAGGLSEFEWAIDHGPFAGRTFRVKHVMYLDGRGHRQLVWMAEDISVLKEAVEALRRAAEEAEAADHAKSAFLANMSHEIRTPLTGIIGFAGLIKDVEGLPPAAAKYNDRVITAGQTLLTVVNDVLDFSKIEAGLLDLDHHPFDPGAFILETLDFAAAQAAHKGLTLTCDISEDLPSAVCADSSRIRQVLLNLIGNAIKFTDHGGVEVSARYLPDDPARLKIVVSDTGAGIPADKTHRLFQRFSQVDGSISRTHGGTGLGLVISKHLTEMMGGEIGVDSVEGEGSTFWFTIFAPPAELEASDEAASPADQACAAARILIVDDVAANRELVSVILSIFGHTLTEATNGQEAVEAALREPFDLILMDLQMPKMDGLAACRAIRATSEINRTTPIVALSANAMGSHIIECILAGMNDHIAKPIDTATLLAKVAQWTSAEGDGVKAAVA